MGSVLAPCELLCFGHTFLCVAQGMLFVSG